MKKTDFRVINGTIVQFQIRYDEKPLNPRDDDNLGTMVCWHRRRNLGDAQASSRRLNGESADDILASLDAVYHLPLYLMDHSGLRIQTTSFGSGDLARFDSGLVGWIYVDRETLKRKLGVKRLSASKIKACESTILDELKREVEVYDDFLSSDIWELVTKTAPLPETWKKELDALSPQDAHARLQVLCLRDGDELDFDDAQCGNFYGMDPSTNGMLSHVAESERELLLTLKN